MHPRRTCKANPEVIDMSHLYKRRRSPSKQIARRGLLLAVVLSGIWSQRSVANDEDLG